MARSRAKSDEWSSSEDESDAGSLEDFIANSSSEEAEEEWAESDGDFVPHSSTSGDESEAASTCSDDDVASAPVLARPSGAQRRSGRVRTAPVRYVDDDYVRLMTEDVDVEAIFAPTSEDESGCSEDESESECESECEAAADAPPRKRARAHLPPAPAVPAAAT